jgi:hypothetical protein
MTKKRDRPELLVLYLNEGSLASLTRRLRRPGMVPGPADGGTRSGILYSMNERQETKQTEGEHERSALKCGRAVRKSVRPGRAPRLAAVV